MNRNRKKAVAVAATVAVSASMLMFGASALFSDVPITLYSSSRIGTVDISVTDIVYDEDVTVDGKDKELNMNPGDNDPYAPSLEDPSYRDGTEHGFGYTVSNLGTKSVRTRHVISLSMTDDNGNAVSPTSLILSSMQDDAVKEVGGDEVNLSFKYYVLDDGTRVEVTNTTAYYVDEVGNRIEEIGPCTLEPSYENISSLNLSADILKIQYVFIGAVLDGQSGGEVNNDGTPIEEIENDVQTVSADYEFYLGMHHSAASNGWDQASIIAEDGKIYKVENYGTSEETLVEVRKIDSGLFYDASEYDRNGIMYKAVDYKAGIKTEVEYIDMSYKLASTTAKDGKTYLVKGFEYDENGNPSGVTVVNNNGTFTTSDGTVVSKDELLHWDISYQKVTNRFPKYYVFTEDSHYEILDIDVVRFEYDEDGLVTDTPIYAGTHKYVEVESGEVVPETSLAKWDTNYAMVVYDYTLGGTTHVPSGLDGATLKIEIEIQAQQYRNTTNDDWGDWTTFSFEEKDYTLTNPYVDSL